MSVDQHQRALQLADEADALAARGDALQAADLLRRAAESEDGVFSGVPAERAKTRGLVAISATSMLQRTGDLQAAAVLAKRYISTPELPAFAEDVLVGVIMEARRATQAAARGTELSPAFEIALRGSGVNSGGLIALDTVLLKLEQFKGYMLRIGEWTTSQPFRAKGPVADSVAQGLSPLISPASAGSYRFEIRMSTRTRQLEAFDDQQVANPVRIGQAFFDILEATVDGGPDGLAEVVPDDDYRGAFLKLVKGIAPTGRELDEIEVAQSHTSALTVLKPELRKSIQRHLDATRQKRPNESVRVGILRALDLDKGTLILRETGVESSCRVEPGRIFDDVVGPLVNRRVRARGQTKKGSFWVSDIDEADDETGDRSGDASASAN